MRLPAGKLHQYRLVGFSFVGSLLASAPVASDPGPASQKIGYLARPIFAFLMVRRPPWPRTQKLTQHDQNANYKREAQEYLERVNDRIVVPVIEPEKY